MPALCQQPSGSSSPCRVKFWLDAQLSPLLASWLSTELGLDAVALRDINLRDADDQTIFRQARQPGVVILTKDRDFTELVARHGAPPQIVWITCGNTSNARMRAVLTAALPQALVLLNAGEPLVEIGDAP